MLEDAIETVQILTYKIQQVTCVILALPIAQLVNLMHSIVHPAFLDSISITLHVLMYALVDTT